MLRIFQLITAVVGVLAVVFIVVGLAVPGWLVFILEVDNELLAEVDTQDMQTNESTKMDSPALELKMSASYGLWSARICYDSLEKEICSTKTLGELEDTSDPGEGQLCSISSSTILINYDL